MSSPPISLRNGILMISRGQSDDDMPNLGSPSKSALFTSKAGGINGGMLASGGGLEFGNGAPNNLGKVGSAAGELSFFRSLSLCDS